MDRSLVGAENHARRILGIDPELVIVIATGRAAHDRDGFAAVLRAIERDVRNVDDVGIVGINGEPVEVPRPAGEARIAVGQRPGVAAVVGAIETGLLACLDQRIHALAIGRDGNTDASPIAIGQVRGRSAASRSRRCRSSDRVRRPALAAARRCSTADDARSTCRRTECSERRRHGQIGDADARSFVEHARPGLASVG